MSGRKWLAASVGLLVLAGILRIPGLSDPFWIDEVISIETAGLDLPALFQRVGFADLHPPSYYLLLSLWTWVFGSGELTARMLSLILGLGSVGVVYYWTRSHYGPWCGIAAALLLALSTFHIHYSVEVRSYCLLGFLSTLVLALADRVSTDETVRTRRWVILVLLEGTLLLTHYYAVIPVLAANMYFFTVRVHQRQKMLHWVLSQAACLACLGLWLPLTLVQYFHLPSGMFAHLQHSEAVKLTLLALGPAPVHPSRMVAWFGSGLLVAAAAAAVVQAFRQRLRSAPVATTEEPFFLPARESRPVVLVLCLLLAAPMLTVAFIEGSEATLPLLLHELPLAYILLFAAVLVLLLAAVVNQRWLANGLGMKAPPFLFAASLLGVALLIVGEARFLPRNVIFLLPLAVISAASFLKAEGALARMAILSLIVGLCLPSVTRQRSFEPRQDFRAAARFIYDAKTHPQADMETFVLPMWDRPGLEYYLGRGSASGIMNTGQIPPKETLPEKVAIVLTREAFQRRTEFMDAIAGALAPKYELQHASSFSRVLVIIFEQPPDRR